jgi:hypothetical protein
VRQLRSAASQEALIGDHGPFGSATTADRGCNSATAHAIPAHFKQTSTFRLGRRLARVTLELVAVEIWGAEGWGAAAMRRFAYSAVSYLNETRSFVR